MRLLESILVATDFGPPASDALRTAQVLAQTFGSKLIIIHVMPKVPETLVKLRPLRMAERERYSVAQIRARKGMQQEWWKPPSAQKVHFGRNAEANRIRNSLS